MNEKTTYDLEYYVNIAKQAFDSQTGDELAEIKKYFGKAYNEAKVVALAVGQLV